MVKDTAILQAWYSHEYDCLVDLTKERHQAYADKHNMDFVLHDLTEHPDREKPSVMEFRHIGWIKDLLNRGYSNVIYLDVDCIIWNFEQDLRDACIDVRGVRFDVMRVKHVNMGAVYVHDCELTRDFIREWQPRALYRIGDWYGCQNAFNIVTKKLQIPPLDCTYNYTAGEHKGNDNPAVKGYHTYIGVPAKYKAMRKDLHALLRG
ncbi:MAG: hypothetical protein BWY95_01033 [Bacteroidetes bacterium ADurb.BinA104]|jgi:hypothetical protein|nr:MAG: hypothetical protein BWY95_01033 [Bacteroidetes bacterium ADurb.BinA104]